MQRFPPSCAWPDDRWGPYRDACASVTRQPRGLFPLSADAPRSRRAPAPLPRIPDWGNCPDKAAPPRKVSSPPIHRAAPRPLPRERDWRRLSTPLRWLFAGHRVRDGLVSIAGRLGSKRQCRQRAVPAQAFATLRHIIGRSNSGIRKSSSRLQTGGCASVSEFPATVPLTRGPASRSASPERLRKNFRP